MIFGPDVAPPRALVRFAPDAKMSDINALLDSYKASIIDAKGGMFRLQFGDSAVSKDEAAACSASCRARRSSVRGYAAK